MSNTLTLGRRVIAVTTAVATIALTVGFAAFAVPTTVQAASAGDLIRGTSLSTVYYYGHDGLRYTFPNLSTYNTWYSNFDGVTTLSDSAIADIDLGGNVVYRPGSRWIKIQSDPKTYAVSTGGTIHWIETEDIAVDLAGSDWNASIDDVADVFFIDYSTGTSLMAATVFDGMMYMDGSDYVLAWNGDKRLVSSEGRAANNMQDGFFLDGSGIDGSALAAGALISANVCNVTDAAQTGCSTTTVSTGDVTVSLSSSTPAGATLPKGANSVQMLSVDLKAGSAAATVDSLVFSMIGVGATTNVANAYLYEGSSRLTEARSVNASTRMVSFNNLGLALTANQTRTLTVRIEVSTSADQGDQIQFSLKASSDVTSAGSIGGSFPVAGNTFTLANATAGTLLVEKNGTIVNPILGADDHKIGQFRVTANTEDASVEEMTLKINNAVDHSDFKLWQGTDLIGTGNYLGKKLVKFDLTSPFTILEGNNKVFKITADIGGENGDDVGVYFDNVVDLVALGGDYGFGMTADIGATSGTYDGATNCDATTDNCSFSDVEGGDITITFTGPSSGDIARNSQDQVLFAFSLTVQNDVTIKDLDIIVYGAEGGDSDAFTSTDDTTSDNDGLINTGSEANLKDIKIINVDTGAVLMGPLELDCTADNTACSATDSSTDGDTKQTIDFTDDFTITAGTTLHLAVTADIDNDVTDGTEFGATLDISGFVAEDSNGDTVATSNIVPSSDLLGFNQTAKASTLGIQLASSPTSTTVVQGTSSVNFLGMVFTAGEASDITITSLTMTGYGDDTDTSAMNFGGASGFEIEDFISSCSLYEDGALVDGPKSISTAGAVVFDTMNWTVAGGASDTLNLECNLANPSDTDNDIFAFDIALDSDITSQDEDSNSPTVTTTPAATSSQGINDTDGDTTTATGNFDASVGITVAEVGTLTVAAGSSTPSADFILAGSSDNHVATYRFTATNESFDVKTLTFSEEQAEDDAYDDATTNGNESTYANNVSKVKITYPKADGTTGTALVSMVGNEAKFSGLDMFVETGKSSDVKVYVNTTAISRETGGSATANEKIRMGFFIDATNDDNFKAVGVSSGVTRDDDNVSAIGDDIFATDGIATFVVRETKPTITLSSASPSGTGFVPGDIEVFRFNVASSSNEDVVLNEVIFKLSSTDNASTSWNFCDLDDSGTGDIDEPDFDLYNLSREGTSNALDAADSEWTLLTTDATICDDSTDVTVFAHLTLATAEIIPAGQTYTFALYFDSTGASASNDDSIQFSIVGDPIVSTYLDTGTDQSGAFGQNATTLTADRALDAGTDDEDITAGDIICITTDADCDDTIDEVVIALDSTGTALDVVRGYLGFDLNAHDALDNFYRLPSSFVWQDDGDDTDGADDITEVWGSYLVDNLPVTGGAMGF